MVKIKAERRHDMVPIDDRSLLANKNGPVGISVQRDAQIGLMQTDGLLQEFGMDGPACLIDIHAVRFVPDHLHGGAQFSQDGRSDFVPCTIGTVHDKLDPLEIQIFRQRPLGKFNVSSVSIVDSIGLSNQVCSRSQVIDLIGHDELFDAGFDLIRKLEAIA